MRLIDYPLLGIVYTADVPRSGGMRISLCLIARDEEELLPDCLASVREEVDEIVLVDTGSRDSTAELARSLGARVYQHRWRDDFAAARNAALDRATGDWILVLDCDERLDAASRGMVRRAVSSGTAEGYLLRLANVSANGAIAEHWLALRLFRNRPEVRYHGRIHEQLRLAGPAAPCPATILHLGYQPRRIAAREKRVRNQRLVEAACRDTQDDSPEQHSFYLFYWAFGVMGGERAERLAQWVRYVEAHPELERPPARRWIPVGLAHYAWQLSDAGAHDTAAARALRLLERHGECPLLHLIVARARAAAGDTAGAERHLALLAAGQVADPYQYFPIDYDLIGRRARRLTAEMREREGRLAEAERGYRRLLATDPADLHAALRLVCVQVQMGAYRQALDTLERFPVLLTQGLPEIDCLGFSLTLVTQSPERLARWRDRVAAWAGRSPLADQMLERVSRQPAGVAFRWSDFPDLAAGVKLGARTPASH
jgi:hypothetical protein